MARAASRGEERAKHPVLLVGPVEESAKCDSRPAEIASVGLLIKLDMRILTHKLFLNRDVLISL